MIMTTTLHLLDRWRLMARLEVSAGAFRPVEFPNVAQALQTAREMKMKTISLTGEGGENLQKWQIC